MTDLNIILIYLVIGLSLDLWACLQDRKYRIRVDGAPLNYGGLLFGLLLWPAILMFVVSNIKVNRRKG